MAITNRRPEFEQTIASDDGENAAPEREFACGSSFRDNKIPRIFSSFIRIQTITVGLFGPWDAGCLWKMTGWMAVGV